MIRRRPLVTWTTPDYCGTNRGFTRTPPGQTGLKNFVTVNPGAVPVRTGCYHFQYRQTPGHNPDVTTGVNQDAIVVKPGHISLHRDENRGRTGNKTGATKEYNRDRENAINVARNDSPVYHGTRIGQKVLSLPLFLSYLH